MKTRRPQSWYPDPRGSGDGGYRTGPEWASGLPIGDRAVWDGGRDLGPCRFPAAGRRRYTAAESGKRLTPG